MILQAVAPINNFPENSENNVQAMYDGSSAAFVSGEFRFFIDSMHGLAPEDYLITQEFYDSVLSSIDIDLVRCPSCSHPGTLEWTDKSYVRSVINTAEDNGVLRRNGSVRKMNSVLEKSLIEGANRQETPHRDGHALDVPAGG